jgi:tetratricopeptide (TPR) repeat protein
MKYSLSVNQAPLRFWKSKYWKQASLSLLIGLPLVSGLLVVTQPNFPVRLAALQSRWFSSLKASYRYPFYDSLTEGERHPTARLQQEIGFYQAQVRQYPDQGLVQAALASAYLSAARNTGEGSWYLLAEQTAQRSLAILSIDNAEALSVLARVTEAKHDFAGALRQAQQIPKPPEALSIQISSNLALGKLAAARQAADALADATLSQSAFSLLALVQTAQGQDQAALKSFDYALEVEEAGELNNSARTRTLLGRFYYERGDLKQAGDLYAEALQILPDYPPALLNQAQLAIRQGDYRAAERHYQQVANLSQGAPTLFDPLILRGRAQAKAMQGDRAGAETLWAEAETLLRQSLGDSSFGHRRDLARLLLERGQAADMPEAVTLMQAEVKHRRDAETLNSDAWALSQAKRWPEAQRVAQEAIASGIRSAGLYVRAAEIERALGNAAQADTYRQKAQQIDPQFDDNTRRAANLGAGLGS